MRLKIFYIAFAMLMFAPSATIAGENRQEAISISENRVSESDNESDNDTEEYSSADASVKDKSDIIADNRQLWAGARSLLSVGFTTGSFDRGKYNGGELNSKWGVAFKGGRNIMVHRNPIANLLKFGIFIGVDLNYMNFEKGHGSLSGIMNGSYDDTDEDVTLGSHYLAGGIAVGPTATVMPFYWCRNKNVARLKIRPFFNLVPSYSALLISNDVETEIHGAFELMYSGGFEIIWRKLSVGFEWKGGRARYKNLLGDMEGLVPDNVWVGGSDKSRQPRLGSKMFTVSIGLEL